MLTIPLLSHLVGALTILFLGIVVYFHDRKSISNRILFLHTLVINLWTLSNYFSITAPPDQALFWIRMVIFFAVPHVFLFFLFIYVFPNRDVKFKKAPAILYILALLVASSIAVSPYGFKAIQSPSDGLVIPIAGALMPIFGLIIVGMTALTVIILIRKFAKAYNFQKQQFGTIFAGLVLSYLLLIILVFLAVNIFEITDFVQFSPFFILPMILGAVYAIFKHQLLGVKVIVTEILTYAIFVILIFQVFLSEELVDGIIRLAILILFLPFGIYLIKSVLKEVEQRERLQKLTEKLDAKNQRLIELDQLKSEFLSFASHQVKSPMSVVKGFAQLIYDGTYGKVSDQVKETAKKIKDSADRMIALINNLLDLRKIEEGKMEYKFEDIDIVTLISSMVEEFKIIAKTKGLEMQFESDKPSIKIKADSEKIKQVIQNIIDNSIKYTPQGSIKVGVKDEGGKILISVVDTGRGMTKELLQNLFERFVRDENVKREIQGTGLGLYIAKEIVTAHHGEIWAESEGEGKGSQFFVRLRKE